MPLTFDPPPDPADTREWTREVEEVVADLVRARLRQIVAEATDAYVASFGDTLIASGDSSAFDGIPAQWQSFVTEEFADTVGGVYLNGSLTAWVQAPGTAALSQAAAQGWAAVVNEDAVTYSRGLVNRMSDVGERLWLDLRQNVTTAITEGMSIDRLSAEIQRTAQFSEYRADMIARTEVHAAMNAGKIEGDRVLGEYGPVEKVWLSSGNDGRTRETHLEADGQAVPIDQPFEVGSALLDVPGDPGGPPEEVINCRCTYLRLFAGDERPDGSFVPGDIGFTVTEIDGVPVEEPAFAEDLDVDPRAPMQQARETIPTARLDGDHFRTAFDGDTYREMTGGRDIFSATDNNDAVLRHIIREQGFNERPTVLTSEAFDRLEDQGWTVMHRGINATSDAELRQFVDNFLYEDDFYVGRGMHGNGVYATTIRDTAEEYARTSGLTISARGGLSAAETGIVMDLALHPAARIIDSEDLYKIRDRRIAALRAERDEVFGDWPTRRVPHPYEVGEFMDERIPLDELLAANPADEFALRAERHLHYDAVVDSADDIGKIAAMEGYDVIRVVNPKQYNDKWQLITLDDTYFVILNRGAVAAREVTL